MNLHRIEGAAEWTAVPRDKRNVWQRIAARTYGVATIGNAISVLGLASVPFGLWLILSSERYWIGVAVLAAGRLLDLLDGWLADKTGTKSPFGEKIDASFDKISIAVTVVVLALNHLLGWFILLVLLLPHALVALMAVAAYLRGQIIHPSYLGKMSMAAGWLCILAFTVFSIYRNLQDNWIVIVGSSVVAYAAFSVSVFLGIAATAGYIAEFKSAQESGRHSKH